MGTWIKDRMQGPGQLIHPRHRYHGFWELNLVMHANIIDTITLLLFIFFFFFSFSKIILQQPYGRGCFTFENACMQHGHYVHLKDPDYVQTEEEKVEDLDAVGR